MSKRTAIYIAVFSVLALTLLLAGWYAIDGQPLPETERYLSGDDFTATQGADGSWVFRPTTPGPAGIVIMHGALIKPQSYAGTAAYFARLGYTVFLPHGGFWRLPVNAVDDVATQVADFGIDDWYLIGHSMGGLASLELLQRNSLEVRAVALWGAGMPFDFTTANAPLLFLWGDDDGILPAHRFETVRTNLPGDTRYVTIEGGNHRNFAMYSHQFFDNDGSLDWREQTGIANELTAAFFAEQAVLR